MTLLLIKNNNYAIWLNVYYGRYHIYKSDQNKKYSNLKHYLRDLFNKTTAWTLNKVINIYVWWQKSITLQTRTCSFHVWELYLNPLWIALRARVCVCVRRHVIANRAKESFAMYPDRILFRIATQLSRATFTNCKYFVASKPHWTSQVCYL